MIIKPLRYKSHQVHGARTCPVRYLCPWSGLASPLLYTSTFDRRRSRIKTFVYIHRA
jgi:hypothetical protein